MCRGLFVDIYESCVAVAVLNDKLLLSDSERGLTKMMT